MTNLKVLLEALEELSVDELEQWHMYVQSNRDVLESKLDKTENRSALIYQELANFRRDWAARHAEPIDHDMSGSADFLKKLLDDIE